MESYHDDFQIDPPFEFVDPAILHLPYLFLNCFSIVEVLPSLESGKGVKKWLLYFAFILFQKSSDKFSNKRGEAVNGFFLNFGSNSMYRFDEELKECVHRIQGNGQ